MARTVRSTPKSTKSRTNKVFVLDTNVPLHDPKCLFRFEEHDLFIPFVTLEELDNHKVGTQDINRNARQATRDLEEITAQPDGDFVTGFPLNKFNGRHATGRLFMQHEHIADLDIGGAKNDNRFLAVMAYLRDKGRDAVLVTKDLNLRVKAKALGFKVEDYKNDLVVEDADMLYRGYRAIAGDQAEFGATVRACRKEGASTIFEIPQVRLEPYFPNEMLVLPDSTLAVVTERDDSCATIATITDYQKEKNSVFGITARNDEQAFALHLLMDPDVDFVTLLGPAGTGKTLLTLAAALEQVIERKEYSDILFTRATVPMGEDIGFLPGSEEEKMAPWLGALYDNIEVLAGTRQESKWHDSVTRELVMRHIQIKSTSFMRGRTFHSKFVILDEAQNLTPKQMKSLITRAGPGTKIVCLGNLAQIDTPYITERSSGLAYAVERSKGWEHFGNIILTKGERSRLANFANENL
ncbi:PhoH family protein [Paraburkholderia sp. UCT31]|uniref:PhoH family protein n=1 Tax=Paraburkholderia sp. UCT31 TaxID=2615209 RepID=UPI001655D5BE|nr:PhoH family protein [Paraburkholderia sp. UCT31]MBC8741880.1 PhoH family protein [Paraburkholderia sp. UCT31]